MARIVSALFLIAHGLIHVSYATRRPKDAAASYPFEPERSWLLPFLSVAGTRGLSKALGVLAAVILAVAGIGLLFDTGWWEASAVAGAVASLLVLALFFHPWLTLGVALDLGIVATVVWWHWPASLFD